MIYTSLDGKVFYIGITKQTLKKRLKGHKSKAIIENCKFHISNKIRSLEEKNIQYNIEKILESENKNTILQYEIEYIDWCRNNGFDLCNISPGGDHPKFTEETKRKLSLSKNKNIIKLTKDFLMEEYINKKRSPKDIAEDVGCCYETVLKKIKKYGIKTRKGRLFGEKNPAKRNSVKNKISISKIGKKRHDLSLRNKIESSKKVGKYKNNILIETYPSVREAARLIGTKSSAIYNNLSGRSKSAYEFEWRYQ